MEKKPKQRARQGQNAQNDEQRNVEQLDVLSGMADEPQSTDVLGSYTGMGRDGQKPVQDADDL